MTRDTIYKQPLDTIKEFAFDEQVACVFDDMIERSIPMYRTALETAAALAATRLQGGGDFYDLGCSTGSQIMELLKHELPAEARLIGVDSSQPMLEQCRAKLERLRGMRPVELRHADIRETGCPGAAVAVLNYTLQFIAPECRRALIVRLHRDLLPDGILILSEKVRHENPQVQDTLTDFYHEFKRRNGYSALEIAQKREALENVLIPYTIEQNLALLREAGFASAEICFKSHVFATFIAAKGPGKDGQQRACSRSATANPASAGEGRR